MGRLEKDEVCVPYESSLNLDENRGICLKTQRASREQGRVKI